jgi:colanic acid/amylovoran biosynthesis protein
VKKAIIINAVRSNGGDAAILLGVAEIVRKAFEPEEVQLTVYDSLVRDSGDRWNGLSIRPALFARVNVSGSRGIIFRATRVLRWYVAALVWNLGAQRFGRSLVPGSDRADFVTYAEGDVIVSTGGTYLVEHYTIIWRIAELGLAHCFGKPLVLMSQSIGPVRGLANRWPLSWALRRAAAVMVRDKKSLEYLRELRIPPGQIHVVADTAFALRRSVQDGT